MTDAFDQISEACRIEVPQAHRRPIALVGAGEIADVAHLPAYRKGGLEVIGITDIDLDRARDVAARHEIANVYPDLDSLLEDARVQVVDVAVTPGSQPAIARKVLESGRHMLGQKPFAPSAAVARDLADIADAHDVVLAVNQQLRFDEGMAAAHKMMELGWLGEVTCLRILTDIWTEWSNWPWMQVLDELEIWVHSIHYHDLVRWFLGEPERVMCIGGRTPGQAAKGETRTISTYSFASGQSALVAANHENSWDDQSALFRLEGTGGAIRGTLGMLYDYPHGRPDTLELRSDVLATDGWVPYPVTTRWNPDAFLGPMASLLAAASGGPQPITSARDNVGTLALVEALYESMRTGQSQLLGAGDS